MKHIPIILSILICACSTKHTTKETPDQNLTSGVEKGIAKYDSIVSNHCEYRELANDFNISVDFIRYINIKDIGDSSIINILVTDKTAETIIDSMKIYSNYLFEDVFMDCKNVLSYSTKVNIDKKIADNYFGDIIVCDLNFDNKEDIAIIANSGGNGGPSYNYYLQGLNKTFHLDKYLTDTMGYFPTKINFNNKTLITFVHAGVCWLGEHTYKLEKTNKWTVESHKTIDICKDEK